MAIINKCDLDVWLIFSLTLMCKNQGSQTIGTDSRPNTACFDTALNEE